MRIMEITILTITLVGCLLSGCAENEPAYVTLLNSPIEINTEGLTWQGSLTAAPGDAEVGWAYYDTVENGSYYWDGVEWVEFSRDGENGDNGEQGEQGVKGDDGVITYSERYPLITTKINRSSVGDSYTDVVGNTYAETINQTRITTYSSFKKNVGGSVSGHVSAGTGSYRLYNVTTSTGGTARTTTSTSEVVLTALVMPTWTEGDIITIQVCNSSAGQTTYIDSGGMFESNKADLIAANGYTTSIYTAPNNLYAWEYVLFTTHSTITLNTQAMEYVSIPQTLYYALENVNSAVNQIITVPINRTYMTIGNTGLQIKTTNISASNRVYILQSYGLNVTDN